MSGFQAIILVCLATTPSDQCNENNAVSVISSHFESELSCMTGWQEVIARGALAADVGKQTYVRTLCRRSRTIAESNPVQ